MRGYCLLMLVGVMLSAGCKGTPDRQMRQSTSEEFATPPSYQYTSPPDIPRDKPLLTPKTPIGMGGPGPNSPGVGGLGNPASGIGGPGVPGR